MTSENVGMTMPVAPYYGGGYGGGDMGFGGMNGWWGLIILLALMGYGNGFGGFGGFGGNGGGFVDADVQRGFDQQSVMTGINGLQGAVNTGFGNVQTALCNGFAGVNQGVANGFAQAEIAANSRQMAEMNQNFAMQTAFQNCCCENRLATANTLTAIAQEGANTRQAAAAGDQMIMNKLCQLELDGVKQNYEGQLRAMQTKLDAANLENQTLKFDASQIRQNSLIQQGLTNEVDALYNRLNNCPVQTIPVYGRQPIFTCGGQGCGCGYNGFAA